MSLNPEIIQVDSDHPYIRVGNRIRKVSSMPLSVAPWRTASAPGALVAPSNIRSIDR